MNNEYIIVNKTKVLEEIEDLKASLNYIPESYIPKHLAQIYAYEQVLLRSTPLIPEIEKAFKAEPTMITDWLNEYGDPEIYKKVERELELREAAAIGKFAEKKYLERLNNFQSIDFKDGVFEGAKWMRDKILNK